MCRTTPASELSVQRRSPGSSHLLLCVVHTPRSRFPCSRLPDVGERSEGASPDRRPAARKEHRLALCARSADLPPRPQQERRGWSSGVWCGDCVIALRRSSDARRIRRFSCGPKDLLCAFFFLPSVIAYVAYARNRGSKEGKRWYAAALGLFLLALLSKSVALTLPLLLLLLDFILFQPGSWRTSALLKEKIPFFVLSLVVGVITMLSAPLEMESDALSSLTSFERHLLPWYNAAFYPAKTIWPRDLSLLYQYNPTTFIACAAAAIAITVALLALPSAASGLFPPSGSGMPYFSSQRADRAFRNSADR